MPASFEANLEVEVARAARAGDEVAVLKMEFICSRIPNEAERQERVGARLLATEAQYHLCEFGRIYPLSEEEYAGILVHVGRGDFPRVLEQIDRAVSTVRKKGNCITSFRVGLAAMPEEACSGPELVSLRNERLHH